MPHVSKQLKVMKRLTALIEGINPTELNYAMDEPYELDLRQKVFRGRTIIGSEVEMPAVAIMESPTPFDALYGGENKILKYEGWRLLVQGFATDDKENPLDTAYDLKAALELQLSKTIKVNNSNGDPLFPEDYMLGNLVAGVEISQGVVRPPDEKVSRYAFCYIPLIVKLGTDVSNPYAD